MSERVAAVLLFVLCPLFAFADDVEDSRRFAQAAIEAYQAKNNAAFLENIRKASDLRPQHPTLLYQLAAALDANGKRDEAVKVLERVASMGFVYDVAKDFTDAKYAKVAKRFEANAHPIGTVKSELTIDRMGLIPEGMAFDGKRFFVSSVRTKTIFAIGENGKAEPFATAPYGVFGIVADAKRGVLWATTAGVPQVEGYTEDDRGKAALLRIELSTGRIIETLRPAGDAPHHFGDVTLAADGEVYVSDARASTIYRVSGSALEPFVQGVFSSLQGIAVSGNTLFAADYSKGLFAIDRRTRDVHPVRVPASASVLAIDGLYVAGERTLIGTQNGTSPYRIIRIELDRAGLAVTSVVTLLANSQLMGDPTLGVIARNRFYFNGNAQWDLFGADGKIADPVKLTEAVVLSVPLR
jgi:sugar lactone lactonase YvrE